VQALRGFESHPLRHWYSCFIRGNIGDALTKASCGEVA
jgi:hypothetical protein